MSLCWVLLGAGRQDDVDEWIRNLASDGIEEREVAEQKLLDAGMKAYPALRKAARESGDSEIRSRALSIAVRVRWSFYLSANPPVEIVERFSTLETATEETKVPELPATGFLLATLLRGTPLEKRIAVKQLPEWVGVEVVDALLDLIDAWPWKGDPDEPLFAQSVSSAVARGSAPRHRERLAKLQGPFREAGLLGLAGIGDERALVEARGLLRSDSLTVRRTAAEIYIRRRPEEAIPELAERIDDSDPAIAALAIAHFRAHPDLATREPFLRALQRNDLRETVLQCLFSLGLNLHEKLLALMRNGTFGDLTRLQPNQNGTRDYYLFLAILAVDDPAAAETLLAIAREFPSYPHDRWVENGLRQLGLRSRIVRRLILHATGEDRDKRAAARRYLELSANASPGTLKLFLAHPELDDLVGPLLSNTTLEDSPDREKWRARAEKWMESTTPALALSGARFLDALGDPRGMDALVKLWPQYQSFDVLNAIVGSARPEADRTAALRTLLEDPGESRSSILENLVKLGDEKTIEEVKKRLKDPDPEKIYEAVRALSAAEAKHLDTLVALLDPAGDEDLMSEVLDCVSAWGEKRHAAAVRPLLKHASVYLRKNVVTTLAAIGDTDSGEEAIEALRKQEEDDEEYSVYASLARVAGAKATPFFKERLGGVQNVTEEYYALADALGRTGDPAAAPVLETLALFNLYVGDLALAALQHVAKPGPSEMAITLLRFEPAGSDLHRQAAMLAAVAGDRRAVPLLAEIADRPDCEYALNALDLLVHAAAYGDLQRERRMPRHTNTYWEDEPFTTALHEWGQVLGAPFRTSPASAWILESVAYPDVHCGKLHHILQEAQIFHIRREKDILLVSEEEARGYWTEWWKLNAATWK